MSSRPMTYNVRKLIDLKNVRAQLNRVIATERHTRPWLWALWTVAAVESTRLAQWYALTFESEWLSLDKAR
ncbi:hypothetical protein Ttaiw_02663 [Tepidimonas taiwanensis]|uniref:Uncharacterized protein n=1 Tax=Tepidimonas taiwanensis TaxID=307486 RepID=A0A554WX92_9BURK|nr:hypothetical protein Ttaiw_02663 [Tepidimonas taiwanensis]